MPISVPFPIFPTFRILVLCLVLLMPGFSSAVEKTHAPPEGSFGGSVDVNVVNVDVFVRDSKGVPVMDLKPEDFVVSRDGFREEISNFSVVTEDLIETMMASRHGAPVPGVGQKVEEESETPEVVLRPIWVALYIDNENLNPIDRTRVLRRIRDFVTESLHPPMQMMVVSNQASLKVVQEFTSDARLINAALRTIGTYSGGWVERRNTRVKIIEDMRETKDQGAGRQNRSDTFEGSRQGVYQRIVAEAREEANDLDFSLIALRQMVDTLSGLDGRKSILYVSNGLPMTPGLGLMHEYATLYHDNSILSTRARFDRQRQFRSLSSRATSQEINFYTVDAEGLQVGLGGGADSSYGADPTASRVGESNFQGPMKYLAERTGGIAVVNTNDVSKGLSKIRSDFYAYYSLGFEVRLEHNDSVHRIEVEIPGRKGLEIRYRKRFVQRSRESLIQDRVATALLLDTAENPMNLVLSHGDSSPVVGERWMVPVHLELPMEKITLMPFGDDLVGRVEIFIGARDMDGRQSDLQRQHHEIRMKAGGELPETWQYEAKLLMEKGSHRVVMAVLDEVSHEVSYITLVVKVP